MNFLELETTTGLTMIRTADISAITYMETCWEIHLHSGTIFRTTDENNQLREWMFRTQGGTMSYNGIPKK
ncbi:MAG: hypothetical protein CMA72_00920 [Euryarchaeota archaeon]|nr:hypothetical protein [Euryarchaeota archaeon]